MLLAMWGWVVGGDGYQSTTPEDVKRRTREALGICKDVAAGMGYIHSMGFIHMDLKPGNVLLRETVGGTSDGASSGVRATQWVHSSFPVLARWCARPSHQNPVAPCCAAVDPSSKSIGLWARPSPSPHSLGGSV